MYITCFPTENFPNNWVVLLFILVVINWRQYSSVIAGQAYLLHWARCWLKHFYWIILPISLCWLREFYFAFYLTDWLDSFTRLQNKGFSRPRTVTCQVLSPAMLKDVSSSLVQVDDLDKPMDSREQADRKCPEETHGSKSPSCLKVNAKSSLVLAGLHACGDLSVTMLRWKFDNLVFPRLHDFRLQGSNGVGGFLQFTIVFFLIFYLFLFLKNNMNSQWSFCICFVYLANF